MNRANPDDSATVTQQSLELPHQARTGPPPNKARPRTPSLQEILDAERWRGQLQGALGAADSAESLHDELVAGVETRRWTLLRDEHAEKFLSFEQFCESPPPFGLGRTYALVQAFLVGLMGKPRADRLTVPPPHQGRSVPGGTSRQNGRKSDREAARLRAVQERAPDPVKRLRDLELLSVDQAAWFGVQNPTEERSMAIDKFAAEVAPILEELGEAPSDQSLAIAKEHVLELSPIPKRDPVVATMRTLRGWSPEQLERFLTLLRAWLPSRGVLASDLPTLEPLSSPVPDVASPQSQRDRLSQALVQGLRIKKARAEEFVAGLGERLDTEPLGSLVAEAARELC